MENKLATIIIAHKNRHDHLKNLLDGFDNDLFYILIIGCGSFVENCIRGYEASKTDKLLFLNDDILISTEQLIEFCNALDTYDYVGSTQIARNNVKYWGLGINKHQGNYVPFVQFRKESAIIPSGFCFGISKSNYELIGKQDIRFHHGYDDFDLGIKAIKANLSIHILDLEIRHFERQSSNRFANQDDDKLLCEMLHPQDELKEIYEKTFIPMNILIVTSEMTSLSGSPLYHYTLALELIKQGHSVDIKTQTKDNEIRNNLLKEGVKLITEFNKNYDLALLSQPISKYSLDEIKSINVFNIVHSEYECEDPIIDNRINKYIAIRPSIKEHLITEHGIDKDKIEVIYNGVDFERFNTSKRKKHKGNYTKVVLPCSIHSLRKEFINFYTKQATEHYRVYIYGDYFDSEIYKNDWVFIENARFDIENYIFDADCIAGILLGRVNLEAMAMGIPSYIHNPDKPSDNHLFELSKKDFETNHNIKNVAKQIIDLYDRPDDLLSIPDNVTVEITEQKCNVKETFTTYFKTNAFHGVESVSGTGSNLPQTEVLRNELPKLFKKYKIKSMLDIPCGDFYWMKEVYLSKVYYVGADIVSELITKNIVDYPEYKFKVLDLINSELPKVDLIFCRDCLVHLPDYLVIKAIQNIKNSGAKYLLSTTFPNRENHDIQIGQWRPINLLNSPFDLHNPILIINENCTENNNEYNDKSMCLWEI